MAESIIQKAGGGAASDECTAAKAQVLAGYTAVTKDSGDEPVAGTMVNQGAKTAALNCGGSYTIPAGYHNGSGKVTANSLASQTGGATAEDKYVLSGKTYWKDGVLRKGGMTVASVASFSVAAYSTSQVLATWKNPSRGPYSGVAICAKTGGYPANINDGRVYTGVGSNSAVNGTSSQIIGGLAAGTTYYFRIWVYCTCSAGDQYSGYLQTTCAPTAHGRQAFTAGGTFTVPANVRSINIHCTGGGEGGCYQRATQNSTKMGAGGSGGYTAYKNNVAVTPGQVITVVVGSGGSGKAASSGGRGGASSATIGATVLVSARGGGYDVNGNTSPRKGGSGGGGYARSSGNYQFDADSNAARGGSNGGNGSGTDAGTGQGTTTRELGLANGTLYGPGGGGFARNQSTNRPAGGDVGGGRGATVNGSYTNPPSDGSAGTGGGGGAGGGNDDYWTGCAGGSGNVIITW